MKIINITKNNGSPGFINLILRDKTIIWFGNNAHVPLSEEEALQLGQLLMDISTKETITELSMKIGDKEKEIK